MEYLQVKTPFIEKWEKEILTNPSTQSELLSQYIDYNKLQDISVDTNAVLDSDKVAAAAVDDIKKAAAAAAAAAAASLKKRKATVALIPTKNVVEKEKEEQVINPETGEPEVVRKEQHNAVEKRRRDKINVTITELKELVPNCKHFATNKASILHHASEHIKHLAQTNSDLLEANRRLQESNSHLIAELTELHRLLWGVHPQHPGQHTMATASQYMPIAGPMPIAGQCMPRPCPTSHRRLRCRSLSKLRVCAQRDRERARASSTRLEQAALCIAGRRLLGRHARAPCVCVLC